MSKVIISTETAPAAIGIYSQAVASNGVLYISGQIPLVPSTMALVSNDIGQQIDQVFQNLNAICLTAGTTLNLRRAPSTSRKTPSPTRTIPIPRLM